MNNKRQLHNQQIVCISSVDWDPLWTRKQQVMSRLPVSNQILYVEPPISLLSPFKDPACWRKWRTWRQGIRRWRDNIYLWSPPVVLPFGNVYPVINRINQWWIGLFLKKVLRRLGFRRPILWTYLPNTADLVGRLDEKLLVYDCVDEHAAYTGFNPEAVRAMERKLLRRCDLVFTTARGLYEDKRQHNPNTYLLPNAANVELFGRAQDPETPVPDDVASLPHPIIGFIGVIQDWVDLGLIEAVAAAHPDWSVVMIGPAGPGVDLRSLQQRPNVHLLGRRDQNMLPGYLKAFDVCLNPFKTNELTRTVSPLKFYEYLASGKPIVTVPMPEIESYGDIVAIAPPERFVQAVEQVLAEETAARKDARLKRAAENSWESRVAFMMDKVNQALDL